MHDFQACVRYIYQFFTFSPNDNPLKTIKNVFYFIKKALFVLKILKLLQFFSSLSSKLSKVKRKNGNGIHYDVTNWFALICRCKFWNNSKSALYFIIKLGQII